MSPAHAVFPPENAASAFMPFGDALYLDCAARTPMLRSVHAAGLAALEANAPPWTQSSEALEAQVEAVRSEEHPSELQSLMRISYAVFCLKKKKPNNAREQ